MRSTGNCYRNYILVFFITVSLSTLSQTSHGEVASLQDNYGPREKSSYAPAKFSYSKQTDSYLTNVQGKLSRKLFEDTNDETLADLNFEYGRLFSLVGTDYQAFGYLTAQIDSDNQMRLNSSLGHYIPAIDGELLFSYRLLGKNLNKTLAQSGSINDKIYENSFATNYTRYSNSFLRETSINYSCSFIPGETLRRTRTPHGEQQQNTASLLDGFSNTTTHEVVAQMAFGYEELGASYLHGLKTSLSLGYEYVNQDEMFDISEQVEESVTFLASIRQRTSIGSIKTFYRYLDSAQTLYTGYSVSGLELYVKETRYQDKKNSRSLGFLIKFNLLNPDDLFGKIKKLFKRSNTAGFDQDRIRHSMSLRSTKFTTQPTVRTSIDS
jgi:hypothetical protein